jgi:hypothetical protein
MLAMLVLALAVPPPPTPAPAPVLQEIGRVRSRTPLCATLRDAVAPSILALLKTDAVFSAGHQTFLTMGKHELERSRTQLEFDRIQLDREVVAAVRNMQAVEALLGDSKRFPKVAATDDERRALAIKAQLQKIAKAQNDALNVISGTLETDRLGQMQHERPTKIDAAIGPEGGHTNQPGTAATDPDLGPVSFLGSAGVAQSPNNNQNPPNAPNAQGLGAVQLSGFGVPTDIRTLAGNGRSIGRTLYDAAAADLNSARIPVDNLERTASQTIIESAQRCSAEPPPAMPLPAPSASP